MPKANSLKTCSDVDSNRAVPDTLSVRLLRFSYLRASIPRTYRIGLAGWLWSICLSAYALPTITQQPQSATVHAGTTVSLSVVATGSGPLAYQWRKDGFPLANASGSFLAIARPSQADSGSYDVLVGDGQGQLASSAANLRVAPAAYPERIVPDTGRTLRLERGGEGSIDELVALRDGRFYVRGSFSRILGAGRAGLARLNADGTLDDTFRPPELDGPVLSMAAQADGRLVIGGEFTVVEGAGSSGLARLNLDGTRDASFVVGAGFLPLGGGINTLAVADDGVIVVGGLFTSYQGRAAAYVAKLSRSGSLVPEFSPPTVRGVPYALATAPDRKVYLAAANVEQGGVVRSNTIVRLLADGTVDRSFDAGSAGPCRRILPQADGRVLVAGQFTNFAGTGPSGFARLNENGSIDTSFGFRLGPNEDVAGIAQTPDGKLLLAGRVRGFGILRVLPDGSIDSAFAPPSFNRVDALALLATGRIAVGGLALNVPTPTQPARTGIALLERDGQRLPFAPPLLFPGSVSALKHQGAGKILVAGNFSHLDGSPVPPIFRLNPDGTVDSSFRTSVSGSGSILAIAIQPDAKIVAVGPLTAGSSVSSAWRLNSDGSTDTTFRTAALSFGLQGTPAVLRDGRIVALDSNLQPGGYQILAPDGTPLSRTDLGAGGDGFTPVRELIVLANGQLLANGFFSTWGGQSRLAMVRLDASGSVDPTFSVASSEMAGVSSFAQSANTLQSSGRIIVAGFRRESFPPPSLQRLMPTGGLDPSFSMALERVLAFNGFDVQADDRIVAWGRYSQSSALPFVVRLLPNGAVDPSFSIVGDESAVNRVTLRWRKAVTLDSGDMLAALEDGRLVRYSSANTPVIVAQPVALVRRLGESATLTVGAVGTGALTYQWRLNGTPIPGATSASFTLPFVLSTHAGTYSVVVATGSGTTTSAGAVLTVDGSAGGDTRLTNLSVRVNLGSAPLITGFTVTGTSVEVLIRGIGPALEQFGIAGAARDPRITLYNGAVSVGENDNWGGSAGIAGIAGALGAFPLPATSLDAALLRPLLGSYTLQLDSSAAGGTALAEVYVRPPATPGTGGRLANLSARYRTGNGPDALIAGFAVSGTGNKSLLVRGIGPTLAGFGVADALGDPTLAVFSGINRVAANDDWGGTEALKSVFAAVGAFALPSASRDAALVVNLPAGSYTVQLTASGAAAGESLIEIYELP